MNTLRFLRTIVLTCSVGFQLSIFNFAVNGAGPANDRFADAQVISGSSGSTTGSNADAGKEGNEPDHADNPGGASIWYRWTAPASGRFAFDTLGSSFDTLLAVYTGSTLGSLILVTNNDDYGFEFTSRVSFMAASGITYQFAVDGYDGETGTVMLAWAPVIPPANDDFANATIISGSSGSVNATNTGATLEPGEPEHSPDPGGSSVWFRWTAPSTGEFLFTTAGSLVDTYLGVYTGVTVNALTQIATNDNYEGEYTSGVLFRATNGITYSIAIDGYYGFAGALLLNWGPAPVIFPEIPLTLRTLHSFTNTADGNRPHSELILSGNTLYGTTVEGGSTGNGTVFKVNTDGTGYTILHSFIYSGGSAPFAGLVLMSNTLYGTTRAGGSSGWGTVFSVGTNGMGFTNLYKFSAAPGTPSTNQDGSLPHAPLTVSASGRTLYGATTIGGTGGKGTLFAVNTDGTGFTVLHHFSAISVDGTNSDGATPFGKLILSGNKLFGTTYTGGPLGYGTVFSMGTNGAGFTNLHSFGWELDGANPHTAILSGNRLYGTGMGGGTFGSGVVFAMNTDGTGYTNLYVFSGVEGLQYTNRTGSGPFAGLVLAGETLYGTTLGGGFGGKGTIFAVNTNGTNFKSLYHFTPTLGAASTNSDGALPRGELVFSGGTLYGTSERGGTSGFGTVFGLSLTAAPMLTITHSQPNVVLRWSTSAAAFSLQATTNPATSNSWSAVGQPAVTNPENISVTLPVTGEKRFFRLRSD